MEIKSILMAFDVWQVNVSAGEMMVMSVRKVPVTPVVALEHPSTRQTLSLTGVWATLVQMRGKRRKAAYLIMDA